MIREHPYIQYFLGYADYRYDISLDPSLLTHFRKRFTADVVAQVNQWIVEATRLQASDEENDDWKSRPLKALAFCERDFQ